VPESHRGQQNYQSAATLKATIRMGELGKPKASSWALAIAEPQDGERLN
jgi:hypothetical protein